MILCFKKTFVYLTLLLFILFCSAFSPSFAGGAYQFVRAPEYNTFDYEANLDKITSDEKILSAVKLLRDTHAIASYKRILGKNPTSKAMSIEFKDLSKIDSIYENFAGVVRMKNGRLHIFVNAQHKDAPVKVIAVLLAGLSVHCDSLDSVNEQIFAWSLEANLWDYFLYQNPGLELFDNKLVKRENAIRKLYIASPENVNYIIRLVRMSDAYNKLEIDSPGYSKAELENKIRILHNIYRTTQKARTAGC